VTLRLLVVFIHGIGGSARGRTPRRARFAAAGMAMTQILRALERRFERRTIARTLLI